MQVAVPHDHDLDGGQVFDGMDLHRYTGGSLGGTPALVFDPGQLPPGEPKPPVQIL
jgi:hypothetical protein